MIDFEIQCLRCYKHHYPPTLLAAFDCPNCGWELIVAAIGATEEEPPWFVAGPCARLRFFPRGGQRKQNRELHQDIAPKACECCEMAGTLNESCVRYEHALEAIRVHASGECSHTADDHIQCFTEIERLVRAATETGSTDKARSEDCDHTYDLAYRCSECGEWDHGHDKDGRKNELCGLAEWGFDRACVSGSAEQIKAITTRLERTETAVPKVWRDTLSALVRWSSLGSCSDCDMFRPAPSAIDWQHHKDCAHLAVINEAHALLGETPEEGHAYDDAPGEMRRLADERARRCMPTGGKGE